MEACESQRRCEVLVLTLAAKLREGLVKDHVACGLDHIDRHSVIRGELRERLDGKRVRERAGKETGG